MVTNLKDASPIIFFYTLLAHGVWDPIKWQPLAGLLYSHISHVSVIWHIVFKSTFRLLCCSKIQMRSAELSVGFYLCKLTQGCSFLAGDDAFYLELSYLINRFIDLQFWACTFEQKLQFGQDCNFTVHCSSSDHSEGLWSHISNGSERTF